MVGELRRLYNYSQLYPNQVPLKPVNFRNLWTLMIVEANPGGEAEERTSLPYILCLFLPYAHGHFD